MSLRKRAVFGLSLAVAATGFYAHPASANPAGTGLVISEVYGAGGNSGAVYNADFVEIFNPTTGSLDLTGMSVQYRSATGTGTGSFALSGSVAAGDTYLVQMSAPGPNGAALTPDATADPAFSMSGSDGQVLLKASTDAFSGSGNLAGNAALVDMVGYGDGATSFEGAPTGVDLTATTSAKRFESGVDTDNNAADFTETVPSPGTIPNDPDARTIAEIQGTGDASPLVGDFVITQGVVTARYPNGGYDGFYIQTGGSPDTAGASDALFVYAPDLPNTAWPAIGASVEVAGDVSEFNGTTEITLVGGVGSAAPAAVTPLSVPWAQLDTDAEKESHEGELVAPQGAFTVTDSFDIDNFAEIGLAAGDKPLISPTDVADAQGTGDEAVAADNAARKITLDDGASINFREAANSDTPYPWLTPTNPVRVGAAVTFTGPVVLEFRNNLWKFQPRRQVTGAGASTATFENTRTAAPEEVGGDIRLATFNVLNYFPTTGVEFDAMPGTTCTFFRDRDGQLTTVNSCNPSGPRGAANEASLARQQAKIVRAINALDASVVSLEELENSVKFGKDRDFAISTLVAALNADAGAGTWAFAPSPAPADMPTPAEEDVIRTGFIYKPADVELVGASQILRDEVNFDNAREPLAQVFKPAGGSDASAFAVIVNHFKSKGSGTPDPDGQGNANNDRIGQANALSAFADSFAADRGVEAVFLAGDFNAYTFEDPMQVLYDDGYDNLESTTDPGEASYSFDGMSGSLDHVVANAAAERMVTGVDIWNINAEEAVAYEYSRYNANETMLFDGTQPFKASDHNPEVVGLNLSGVGTEEIQVLGTNDFHGRILNAGPGGPEAGAAVLSGAVKQLRAANPNTVFAAAGDLIGASTFESFIQDDKPTIDALNEAGLDVSAVGNHEFDQGYDDLVNRVMAPYDATTNPRGGAEWQYIGANVKLKATGDPAVPASWIKDFGDVEVGFVGAVTEDLPSLVTPSGIEEIEVTDIVAAANETADDLEAEGADVVVLLVHEGAPATTYESATDPANAFGQIVNGVDANIDAIVSGHTHLAYNHSVPVPAWEAAGRAVTTRPVVSAGQYGTNLNKLVFTVDARTGDVVAKTQSILALTTNTSSTSTANWVSNYPADPAIKPIVDAAVAQATTLGSQELGQVEGPFNRARLSAAVNNSTENRGGESTLGNLVAEVQRWATEAPESGGAQIAFMNPGGLRADMVGTVADGYPEVLTYRQAANVQPFANTLVNMQLTGAQVKTALEQQWQRDSAGNVPSRPFLRLGTSEGFTYTYDPALPEGSRVTGMWLDGNPIVLGDSYSVTVNSFLASGGDNFRVFTDGTAKRDTGKVDLQAMVDYMAAFAADSALPVDWSQRSVGVSFPAAAPATYLPGEHVRFDLSSLAFTAPGDLTDSDVEVSLGGQVLGTFPVDNARGTAVFDEYGTAAVDVVLPAGTPAGEAALTVTGLTTGTSATVTIPVASGELPTSTVSATADPFVYGRAGSVDVTVDPTEATGDVQVFEGETLLGEQTLTDGAATVAVPARTLKPGAHTLRVVYVGDERFQGSETELTVVVGKAKPVMTVKTSPRRIERRETRPVFDVALGEVGFPVAGKVTVSRGGESWTRRLADGKATFTLPTLRWAGEKTYRVTYLGNADAQSVAKRVTITVVG